MDALAPELLSTAAWLIVVLMGALVTVLGWIGRSGLSRLDTLENSMNELFAAQRREHADENKLVWEKLGEHGERLTRMEARCSIQHPQS